MKKYYLILIIYTISSCSTQQPDLEIKELSISKIEEMESLKNFILADFTNLLDLCKQHAKCYDYYGEKCYFPANSSLLHKYKNDIQGIKQLDYLIDNGIITGNINIRSDSTIRFQIKYQLIRGNFDTYKDTVYHHEIVYSASKTKVYELGEFVILKSKTIKPQWVYFITKQWVD